MKIALITLSAATVMLVAGCSTPASYVDASSSRVVTEVGRLNIQDFANAADKMTQSLIADQIASGKLKSGVPGEPALMAISRIVNNTGQQLDTDMLVKKMRVALNKTGAIQATTTGNLGGAEDPLAAANQKQKEFFEDQKHTRLPDYTLSGKIIQDNAKAGSIRQSSFIFQLSLSSSSGIAVWEDEQTIVKQGNRSSVGF